MLEREPAQTIEKVALGLFLALPWLYPFASGPSPSVQQWLTSIASAVLIVLLRAGLTPELVLRAWVLSATISGAIALLQYTDLDHLLSPWVANAAPGEVYGNLRQRNQFATFSNIGLAALIWLPLLEQTKHPKAHSGMFVVAAILGVANAASASRTGLMQLLLLAVLVTLWGLWGSRETRQLLMTAVVAYAVYSLTVLMRSGQDGNAGVWGRILNDSEACTSRLALWSNVLALISDKPWVGWGWGQLDYAHFVSAYEGRRFCAMLNDAHNLFLQIAVELGLPAAFLVCIVGLIWISRARPWSAGERTEQAGWAVLGLLLAHSMVEYPLWYGPFQIAFLLSLWLLAKRRTGTEVSFSTGSRRTLEWSLGGSILLALAYAAWDYHRISQIYLPPEQRAPSYRENTLEKIRDSWLFSDQVRFAEYTTTPLTPNNAEQLYAMGLQLLHYSPEARVVEKLIESAVLLGRDDEARFYLARYKAAYPQEHARWAARQREPDEVQ